jgi:hypothetical protein
MKQTPPNDIAERVALDGLIDSARRARAAEEAALLRALRETAPSE